MCLSPTAIPKENVTGGRSLVTLPDCAERAELVFERCLQAFNGFQADRRPSKEGHIVAADGQQFKRNGGVRDSTAP